MNNSEVQYRILDYLLMYQWFNITPDFKLEI